MSDRHRNRNLFKRCDCPRRTWARCPHSWWTNFKPKGGPAYRISLDKHAGEHVDRKAAAEDLATTIKTAIQKGTYGTTAPLSEMTLTRLVDTYLERYVDVQHAATAADFRAGLRVVCGTVLPSPTGGTRPFGEWRLTDIVTDTVERYREARRAAGAGLGGSNRSLSRLRAVYNWAVRVGYVTASPFNRGTEAVVKLAPETPRSRRLDADQDEAGKLLKACAPHLRALVEAALETGMRRGELSSLQWQQVFGLTIDLTKTPPVLKWAPRSEIFLTAVKTKTKRDRHIPISTRLKAILEMRRFDPTGQPFAADQYVFGNVIGQRVTTIKRAWHSAVLKAHGHLAVLTEDTLNLDAASRATLATINLHFHDLRREAGSRWLEGGVPLHTIRDWLGHSNISQTSTYLSGTMQTQHDAMAAYEARVAAVQQRATDAQKDGRKSPETTDETEETLNETGPDRPRPIM